MTKADTFKAWWSRQGRWSRRGLWGLAGLLGLWALTWALVPPLLRWQLQAQASDILGRAVTVERVRFSPWSLELELTGLKVASADPGREPQVQVQRFYIDAELQSLLRLAPVLDAVELDAPLVRLRHLGEGRYDIDDVLKRLAERPASPDEAPARFALYNLRLSQGGAVLEDVPAAATHRLEGLELAVPFLSNLKSQREVVTQPRLAFTLNGSAFDSQAETTPFAPDHATQARLAIKDFDLAPYLGYWPAALPVKPASGRLQADMRVAFEQREGGAAVKLDGDLALENARILSREGADLLAWERLAVRLADTRPLENHVGLERIEWMAPQLTLSRAADGAINLQRLLAQPPKATPAAPGAPSAAAPPWTIALGEFHLQRGRVAWQDQALKPVFATALEELDLKVGAVQWPIQAPMPISLSARHQRASLQVQGQATDREAQLDLELKDLALADAEPYLRERLTLPLVGQLGAKATVAWRAGEAAEDGLRLGLTELVLADLRLGEARAPQAGVRQLRVSESQLDLNARRLNLGRVLLEGPQLQVERDNQGRWMVERWLRADPDGATAQTEKPDSAAEPPWALGWTALQVQGGTVRLDDRANTKPARLDLANLSFSAGPWRSDAAGRTPLTLDTRVAAPGASRADPGRLQVQGPLGWKPGTPQPEVTTNLRITANALPAHALEPYVSERLNLELLRADAGYRGQLDLGWTAAGLRVALNGDVALDEFRANTLSPSEELLAWKALNLRGLQLAVAPGQPLKLQVAETALSDWYARIAIDETGRINLQDLIKPEPASAAAATPASSSPAAPASPPPELRFGPVALVKGRVLFSDRFIKPNYSANLSELTGKLSAFSNQPASPGAAVDLADLELLGRVEGTASLVLNGRINPLAQPLALDIKGQVRDLELPPLSPYTVKYAGYGIERGKLSVDVTYKISPDGRLEASNQIVLNQLTFGERVAGSEAPNLPVKLAVALLADRNGVIDINLPVSGSMNDPEFRLGPVIVKVIFNLIGKAITAPFALLASAFGGGGEESSQVAFAPGSARLDAAARERLDAVAKALTDRPALRLTVVGSSDLERERVAYQRERLNELVRAEKRRALARGGAAADGETAVSEAEYPALLKEVYRRADITKPRNVIGMAKDLPVADMEALLMTSVPVSADTMRELALQRSVAVRDYLASRQLPTERLFTGAPRAAAAGSEGASDTAPRAELQLSAR